jgi:flavorubredoxin
MIKSLKFREKNAIAYGTYGWSGESTKIINEELENAKFNIIDEPLLVKWNPNEEALKEAYELGKKIAKI